MRLKFKNLFCYLLFVTAFFLNYSLPAVSEEICDGSYACAVPVEREDGKIDFSFKNIRTYEITITLNFTTLENLRANVTLPYTITIPGNSTIKILTLEPKDTYKKWQYYFKYKAVDGSLNAHHDDDYVYSLPYAQGKSFRVAQGFNGDFSHKGEQRYAIDWAMPEGTEIYAARDGVVAGIKDDNTMGGEDKSFAIYANFIIIKHSDGTFGGYLHLKKNGVIVSLGEKVKAGQMIGYSGNTGWSTAPHLHFWVYKALSGSERESFPIRFNTVEEDEATLQEGNYYTAE